MITLRIGPFENTLNKLTKKNPPNEIEKIANWLNKIDEDYNKMVI